MAQYIPEKTYVGAQGEFSTEKPPLGFLTPWGTNAAAKKRMGTVDDWTGDGMRNIGRGQMKKTYEPTKVVLDNPPMSGFQIGKEVRRYSTNNVLWRIMDPRGFELEISSGNMAYLLQNSDIVKGELQGEMQWCRDGSDNYLLPVGSEAYEEFKANSEALTGGVSVKDIKRGDEVRLPDGTEGTYLGAYFVITFNEWVKGENRRVLYVRRRQIIKRKEGGLYDKASIKNILVLKEGKPEDDRDYSKEIDATDLECGAHGVMVTIKKPKERDLLDSLELKPAEFPAVFPKAGRTYYTTVESDNMTYGIFGYGGEYPKIRVVHFDTVNNIMNSKEIVAKQENWWGRSRDSAIIRTDDFQRELMLNRDAMQSLYMTVHGEEVLVS